MRQLRWWLWNAEWPTPEADEPAVKELPYENLEETRALVCCLRPPWGLCVAQDTLGLDEAISMALANEYGIRIVRNEAAVVAAQATAGNAGLLPRLDAIGSWTITATSTRGWISPKVYLTWNAVACSPPRFSVKWV